MEDNFKKAIRLSQEERQKERQVNLDEFKEYISKELTTLGIGVISELEETIGYLWGHGKPEKSLTENELRWRESWQDLRTAILDRSNYRLRRILRDIDKRFNVKYSYQWRIKNV